MILSYGNIFRIHSTYINRAHHSPFWMSVMVWCHFTMRGPRTHKQVVLKQPRNVRIWGFLPLIFKFYFYFPLKSGQRHCFLSFLFFFFLIKMCLYTDSCGLPRCQRHSYKLSAWIYISFGDLQVLWLMFWVLDQPRQLVCLLTVKISVVPP